MREGLDPELQEAYEKGNGIGIAKAVIQPFNFPESVTDIGTVDAADAADTGETYLIRVRKSTNEVQVNRFLKSGYATAANWNSWGVLTSAGTNITRVGIFFYTGAGIKAVYIFYMKTGNTNLLYKSSTDEGATWSAEATLITTANTMDLIEGIHEGGFMHRNVTTNQMFLYAYKPSDGTFVINEIPVPDTANVVLSAKGSKRTININGTDTDITTIALISEVDATIGDNRLWIGSATNYLTLTETWTSATVIRAQGSNTPQLLHCVFDDYISFTQTDALICKLLDYYGITWGYLPPGTVLNTANIIGYDSTGTKLIYNNGFYSPITGVDEIEYTALEYHSTRESLQCRVTGTTIPVDGILIVSRGYHAADTDYYVPLTPYRIVSWRTNPDRTFTIQAVTGYMALQGRDLPPGLQINVTRAQTLRLCFAAIGISCTPNSEDILNAQPYTNAAPTITTLSAAVTRQNNAGSIELWNTEYGLRAIATQSTTSTQTITPDGGLLPHKDYSQSIGLQASWPTDVGGVLYNIINTAVESIDGGYPYWPRIVNFPYNPADFDQALIGDLHAERRFLGFFGTRANMSLEPGDVVTIVSSLIRIVDIIESFPLMFQEIRYRWHTEPLALGDYGITPTESSSSSISIAPIQGHIHTATNVQLDTTNFDGILSDADNNAQAAMETIDDHTHDQDGTPFAEAVQDVIGGMVSGNVETNIAVTYDDTTGKLDFSVPTETIQDIVGAMVTGNVETGIDVTYDDTNAKIDFALNDSYVNGLIDDRIADMGGWIARGTWTRTGNHTFTEPGDLTTLLRKGAFVRYKDGGSYEYGVIASSSHAGGTTTINLIPNTNYAMAAATITDNWISYDEKPEGFPTQFDWTPTHSRSGTNYTNLPTTTFAKWKVIGTRLFYREQHEQNATPGGTLYQRFTLPVTPDGTAALSRSTANGMNLSAAYGLLVFNAEAEGARIFKYDGTQEALASNFYLVNGEYEL